MPGSWVPHHLPQVASTLAGRCAKNICIVLQQTSLVIFSTFFRNELILAFKCHKRIFAGMGWH